MQTLYTNLTASLTELRDPMKVIEKANGKPVAILNRNNVIGYFVPSTALNTFEAASREEVIAALQQVVKNDKATLDYLRDK